MTTAGRGRGSDKRGQQANQTPGDQAHVWSPPQATGLTLLRARFRTQTFARHSHEGYGVGVIEAGALAFDYRGAGLLAPQGAVNTVNPDEPHTGRAATNYGWAYRMFYFSPEYLAQVAEDVAGGRVPLPFFTSGVIHDPGLAALLLRAHALNDCPHDRPHDRRHNALAGSPAGARTHAPTNSLADAPSDLPGGDSLARESLLLHAFARLLARHSYLPPPLPKAGAEHAAVARVKAHLRERIGLGRPPSAPFNEINQPGPDGNSGLTLAELARVACLSPYHFIRVFARHTGLPPHAWLMQLRARKAGELLRQGAGIAQAAAGAGFADQSHLTRTFKRLLGYTPGQFRNSVQGA